MIHELYWALKWARLLALILILSNDDNIYGPCKLWWIQLPLSEKVPSWYTVSTAWYRNVPVPDKNTFVCLTGSLKNICVCESSDAANFYDQHLAHFFHVLCLCLRPWQLGFNKPVWDLSFERDNFRNDSSEGSIFFENCIRVTLNK